MAEALPEGVTALDDDRCARLLPVREPRGHKGSHGTVLVVAGSLEYAGAALLVARAAGRAGAGLVRLAVPASLQPLFAGRVVEATTLALPETEVEAEVDPEPAIERLLDSDHDALVVGPGLRPGLATVDLVAAIVRADGVAGDASGDLGSRDSTAGDGDRGSRDGTGGDGAGPATATGPPPAVLDAEALNSLASLPEWWRGIGRPCVLTPHVGEFRRLRAGRARPAETTSAPEADLSADDAARAGEARTAASEWGATVVLKGARTVIAAADGRVAQAPFENPALASAGTGDVLAGAIGSLLAQGLAPFDAACLGVYLHGVAGEVVRERLGDAGLLASDLPDELARARRRLGQIRERLVSERRLGFRVAEPQP